MNTIEYNKSTVYYTEYACLHRFRRVGYAVPHGTDGGTPVPYRTHVTTNLGFWERNAIYGRNANGRPLGGCAWRARGQQARNESDRDTWQRNTNIHNMVLE